MEDAMDIASQESRSKRPRVALEVAESGNAKPLIVLAAIAGLASGSNVRSAVRAALRDGLDVIHREKHPAHPAHPAAITEECKAAFNLRDGNTNGSRRASDQGAVGMNALSILLRVVSCPLRSAEAKSLRVFKPALPVVLSSIPARFPNHEGALPRAEQSTLAASSEHLMALFSETSGFVTRLRRELVSTHKLPVVVPAKPLHFRIDGAVLERAGRFDLSGPFGVNGPDAQRCMMLATASIRAKLPLARAGELIATLVASAGKLVHIDSNQSVAPRLARTSAGLSSILPFRYGVPA